MARILVLLLITIMTQIQFLKAAWAESHDYTIFDMRKSLPLTDSEAIYHDYYTNLGTEDGAKVGSLLVVYRKVPVIDIYRNKTQGDLVVAVARLQVIHAQKTMSVARIVAHSDPKKIPVVQFENVMLGDRVELMPDAKKPSEPTKQD